MATPRPQYLYCKPGRCRAGRRGRPDTEGAETSLRRRHCLAPARPATMPREMAGAMIPRLQFDGTPGAGEVPDDSSLRTSG